MRNSTVESFVKYKLNEFSGRKAAMNQILWGKIHLESFPFVS